MGSWLRALNNLPFSLTIKHYVALGPLGEEVGLSLRSAEDWHILREKHPRYRIPEDREVWLRELTLKKDGQDSQLQARVDALATLIEKEGITSFYSIGSGGGVFEYFLKKRLPHLRVIVSEPTAKGVERLKKVFLEVDDILELNALSKSTWEMIAKDTQGLVFIYRNEHEFTNSEWQHMINDMHTAGVRRVYLGLMYLLTVRAFLQMKVRNLLRRLRGEHLVFAGYVRNYVAFKKFWKGKYLDQETPFPGCRGFYLTHL